MDCRVREWAGKLKAEYGSGGVQFGLSEWARHLSVDLVGLVVFGVDMGGCTQNREDVSIPSVLNQYCDWQKELILEFVARMKAASGHFKVNWGMSGLWLGFVLSIWRLKLCE